MKKYISIAAILAAGTVFANAETLILTLPSSESCNVDGYIGNTANGLSVLNARLGAGYGVYAGNAGGAIGTGTGTEGDWTQTTSTSGFITLAGRNGAGGENLALVLGSDIESGSMIDSITFSYEISKPGSSSDLNIDGLGFSFALGYATLNEFDTLAYLQTTDELVTYSAGSSTGTMTLSFTEAVTWTTGDKIVLAMSGPKSADPSATSIYNVAISDVSVSVIPEPSAFGLLAGLGALALVGARRRRK